MRKPIIAGNWKMHKTIREATDFAKQLLTYELSDEVEAVICAPYTAIRDLTETLAGTEVGIGAQNFHYEDFGAFTGEISAPMLKELGARYVILGHSERRQYFGETDEAVNQKTKKAIAEALTPIICVGETLAQREQNETKEIVRLQVERALAGIAQTAVEKIVIAYEPIWAIGTGKTATAEDANEVCAHIRSVVKNLFGEEAGERIRIQYGGSVKPSNIREIMAQSDIDGALIGGAALVVEDYVKLVNF